jgi:serine/threonine protein kinase
MIRDGVLTHFQAEQLLQGKWRRFTIGKYKVLERLGSGGMGSVYLCEHKLMRRRVAVKVLPAAKAAEPSSLERFYREARAVASLDHPNIVHAYDIDQDETLHFLVMEYVDGSSLQDIIKKTGPMDPNRAAHYIWQATLGLEHAHAAGLVHRDIKPGNLLIDRGGTVKILDMGLARFFNDEEDILTKKYDENVLGTADYLAPEQAVDSHEADTRADIYSLGATFYYMLTGRTPFEEGTIAQKLIWHQTRQPKPVTAYRNDVAPELVTIIQKMMAKQPEDRYQHPRELSQALATWGQRQIAPPPDAEMPRLSPAATGAPSPETTQSAAATQAGPSSSRRTWQVTPSPTKSAAISTPPPATHATQPMAATPAVRASAPATRPAPAAPQVSAPLAPVPGMPQRAPAVSVTAAAAPQVWADIADDTSPRGTAETLTGPDGSVRSGRRVQVARKQGRLWLILILVIVVVMIASTIVAAGLFFNWFGRPANERRPLVVTKQRTGERVFPTLVSAVRAAEPGDVIELADEQLEENVQITAAHMKSASIILRAAPGKKVVWTGKKGSEDRPLLHLHSVKGFLLEGENITLDGQDRTNNLLLISGQCPGLEIRDLKFKSYTDHAIKIMNCAGDEGKYVRITKPQAEPPLKKESPVVYLGATAGVIPARDDYLDLRDCLFPSMTAKQSLGRLNDKILGDNLKLPPGFSWQ